MDEQLIERRRGRNGGIYLLPDAIRVSGRKVKAADEVANSESRRESSHYEPLLAQILKNWTGLDGFKHVFGSITAAQGRKSTGGRWSRPDLILCTISEWIFSSRPEGDIRTIKIKRYDALNVLAVYEALSHKTRSHYAYLLIVEFPEVMSADQQNEFEFILSVAGTNGIGVITAKRSDDWSTWQFPVDPALSNADHQAIHQMVLDQVPPETRKKFEDALRKFTVSMG